MRSGSASARKPTWPRLTPSSGDLGAAGDLGGTQQGPVAAEHDDQLAAGRRVLVRADRPDARQRRLGRLLGEHPHADARGREPLGGAPDRGPGLLAAGVPDEEHLPLAATRAPGHCGPSATARSSPAGSRSGRRAAARGSTRRCPPGRAAGSPSPRRPRAPAPTRRPRPRRPRRRAEPARARRRRHRAPRDRPRTAASPSPPGRRPASVTPASAGSTSRRLMNDRSATTRSTGPPTWAGSSSRTLVRSSTVTRSSVCSDQASCP